MRADSTVCVPSVRAVSEPMTQSLVHNMSRAALSLVFLHTEDPVFKEQLYTRCHLYLLLTLLPQPQIPFPLAQHSILLWLIMLVAINVFTGFSISTGKGPPLHASFSHL